MGKYYSHLSLFERQSLFKWYHYEKRSIREIARRLRRSYSTISRELKRNISSIYVPTYYPHPANDKYIRRVVFRARRPRLKSEETKKYVIEKLKIGWAPEIISSRLKAEDKLSCVSHEAIYQYIYKDAEELIQYLPRKHKKRKKKYKYRTNKLEETSKISILDRPEHIGNRTEFGHWESDSIESKNRKNSINVLVERVYRYVHITKLDSKKACDTANAIINKLSKHPEHFCQSITYDNGSENAQHQKINIKLKTLYTFVSHIVVGKRSSRTS